MKHTFFNQKKKKKKVFLPTYRYRKQTFLGLIVLFSTGSSLHVIVHFSTKSCSEPTVADQGRTGARGQEVQVRVRGLYLLNVLPEGPGAAHAHPHRRETLRVPRLRQGLQQGRQAQDTHARPHRPQAIQMSTL